MANAQFGPGALYVKRTDIPNQTPINIGFAQELEFDESGDLVENYGQYQSPIDAARGTVKNTAKFKAARFSGIAINSVFHGQTLTAGSLMATPAPGELTTLAVATVIATTATTALAGTVLTFGATAGLVVGQVVTGTNIPAGTAIASLTGTTVTLTQGVTGTGVAIAANINFGPVATVLNATNFNNDLGVVYGATGTPMLVGGAAVAAAAGQYSASATGQYFFHPGDGAKQVYITYAYGAPLVGQTKTVMNQVLGYTPNFQIDYVNIFQGRFCYVRIFNCVGTKFSRAFKLKEFAVPSFECGIQADVMNRIYTETYPDIS